MGDGLRASRRRAASQAGPRRGAATAQQRRLGVSTCARSYASAAHPSATPGRRERNAILPATRRQKVFNPVRRRSDASRLTGRSACDIISYYTLQSSCIYDINSRPRWVAARTILAPPLARTRRRLATGGRTSATETIGGHHEGPRDQDPAGDSPPLLGRARRRSDHRGRQHGRADLGGRARDRRRHAHRDADRGRSARPTPRRWRAPARSSRRRTARPTPRAGEDNRRRFNEIRGDAGPGARPGRRRRPRRREVTVRVLRTERARQPGGYVLRPHLRREHGRHHGRRDGVGLAGRRDQLPAAGHACPIAGTRPAGPGNNPDSFDPDKGDDYVPWQVPGSDPPEYNDGLHGLHADRTSARRSRSSRIRAAATTTRAGTIPGVRRASREPTDYRTNVSSCVDPTIDYGVGMEVETEPGNMRGPTLQGFGDLISQDPAAVWNEQLDCITDATERPERRRERLPQQPAHPPGAAVRPDRGSGERSVDASRSRTSRESSWRGSRATTSSRAGSATRASDARRPGRGRHGAGPQFQVVQLIK